MALPSKTSELFNAGDVISIQLLDEDGPRIARVVLADTVGLAVTLSKFQTWVEFLEELADDYEFLDVSAHRVILLPWHNVQEVMFVLDAASYAVLDAKAQAGANK